MHNTQVPMEGKPGSARVAMTNTHREFPGPTERGGNEQIKRLLKSYGLRTSLIRLKVIDALLKAAEENRRLGVRGVHSQLLGLDIPLSFLSVREVLKRLCSEGVVTLNPDKSYSLHHSAVALLNPGE
ncbi:fe2+ zn2+ uptake regulation protein [Pseudomonas sp. SWRI92]|uniref:Fe2+ zn2+ uptake regulation protein n=1 Tax=Pseudomonas marvdashtae TaxID=2745500 RepID=A0A923FK52_9PSED|nr:MULTISPECIES: fe2+ zn2+ uptake regulation protein [Pseudomonas]MBC3362765.1 fe2+ zn2+ uptake regulation protein [Pseudomonas sp. SWRI154]MBC3372553.1 fe2+ zn2+ uptake regulation protein [Pseudomonas sp. SWRI92]MBV4551755.1 fe2+ zn2+ uptake regulation protein [Pseudomonas marvdashtae]